MRNEITGTVEPKDEDVSSHRVFVMGERDTDQVRDDGVRVAPPSSSPWSRIKLLGTGLNVGCSIAACQTLSLLCSPDVSNRLPVQGTGERPVTDRDRAMAV